MSADYKPGTVAMVTNDEEQLLAFRVSWPAEDWMSVDDGSLHAVSDVRPLVVLDLKDAPMGELVEGNIPRAREYAHHLQNRGHYVAGDLINWLADQIEAQSRPPKPPEPQGLGAVVEDTEGRRWVRGDNDHCCWFGAHKDDWFAYRHIDAVRVLSEGVQP